MKTYIYIGNHLSKNGGYPSSAESLEPYLAPQILLKLVSRKANPVLRLLDMVASLVFFGTREKLVIIDVFSTRNFYYSLLAGIICRFLDIKYYCVLRGGGLPNRLKDSPRLSKELFAYSFANIAPSKYLQNSLKKAGYDARVIPNFIPISNYPFLLRKRIQPRLLWVRAFDKTYNPQLAIRVLQRLVIDFPDAKLCMVGPDKDGSRATCEGLVNELGLINNVTFTGRLTKKEWVEISVNYDIFINTTNFDNTPVSVIEALALGFPVVSTNVGGLPYLIEDNNTGLLIEKGDEDAMVKAILRLIADRQLTESLSINGRKRAEEFDISIVKEGWLNTLV